MANTYKILGQVTDASSETDLYTVPSDTSAVISSIIVCNRRPDAKIFTISISPAGASTDSKDYIYYEVTLAGNDTFIATVGITLAATDVVRVSSDDTRVSFSIFGTEIS
jgi:hypothetical protein